MKAIGLMAGTSLDGIDAVVVDLERTRWGVNAKLAAHKTFPYSGETVRLILDASDPATSSVDKVARLDYYLGELFAEAALGVMAEAKLRPVDVEFIGSHGQTIHHLPAPVKMGKYKIRATLQVAEPSIIAARTGITTVADFRPADIGAGGEGAPLVPFVDFLLFRHPKLTRFLLNLGGIANATLLPAGTGDPEEVVASDIGPGNMIIDELVRRMTNFKESYDKDGRYAAKGKVIPKLLAEMMDNAFIAQAPPKSTGRERFGGAFVDSMIERAKIRDKKHYPDLIATAAQFTAEAVFSHYARFHQKDHPADEIIVSGGGALNKTVMDLLAAKFSPVPVMPSDERGVPALAKEAIAFAILAMETLRHRPGNLPGATGAQRRAVLGKIIPPPGK